MQFFTGELAMLCCSGLRDKLGWASVVKTLFTVIFVLLCCSVFSAQPSRNLAYDDGFVWYLAGRLASDQTALAERSGIKLSEGEWGEQRQQFEIVYHHYLVRCDGPLPQLAEVLKFADVSSTSTLSGTQLLAYAGSMDHRIWPQIQGWHTRVSLALMAMYRTGKYGFLPECVVSGFREQNPLQSPK